MPSQRFTNAVGRNLAEIQRALLNRTTMAGIEREGWKGDMFLRLVYFALFNDYTAHCIKVLDRSRGTASFWYIYKTDQGPVDRYLQKRRIDIVEINDVADKLKHIRDRTHFHIDFESVESARAVWREAGLAGNRLAKVVDQLWSILTDVQQRHTLAAVTLPDDYDVEQVRQLIRQVKHGRDT